MTNDMTTVNKSQSGTKSFERGNQGNHTKKDQDSEAREGERP